MGLISFDLKQMSSFFYPIISISSPETSVKKNYCGKYIIIDEK